MALSTGTDTDQPVSQERSEENARLPPTPNPMNDTKTAHETKFGAAPAAIPKTAAIKRVVLKASRLPMRSEPRPQKPAPQTRPAMSASDKNAEC